MALSIPRVPVTQTPGVTNTNWPLFYQRSLPGLINSSGTFCTKSAPLTIHRMRGMVWSGSQTDRQRDVAMRGTRWGRTEGGSTSSTRESFHRRVSFCDYMEMWRRKRQEEATGKKAALCVIFPSRSIYSGSIWTPLRQRVFYSSPIWCGQQKNMIALPCLRLPCIVTDRLTAGHYSVQKILCDTTPEGVMSPWRRFYQESPCWIITEHLATRESFKEDFIITSRYSVFTMRADTAGSQSRTKTNQFICEWWRAAHYFAVGLFQWLPRIHEKDNFFYM